MGAILQQASQLQLTRGLLILLCVVRLQGSCGPLEIRSNASVHVSFLKKRKNPQLSPASHPDLQTSLCSSTIKDSLEVAPGVLLRVDFNGINIWDLSVCLMEAEGMWKWVPG